MAMKNVARIKDAAMYIFDDLVNFLSEIRFFTLAVFVANNNRYPVATNNIPNTVHIDF